MKLSEILKDWPENRDCTCGLVYCECTHYVWNDAITACDREIDREALEDILCHHAPMLRSEANDISHAIISNMPTWLKPTERK